MFKDQFKSPVPSGVTDEQILVGEQLLKNLKTKGRKLNAYGGIAGMLGEPTYADGGRTGFKGKKFDPTKRTFMKVAAGLATLPIVGKYFKWLKPFAKTSKVLTSASEITQPAYLGSLIEVIKAKGVIKEIGKKGHKITEYKGVHLEEGPGIKTIYKKGKNKKIHQEVHEGEMHIKDEGLDTQKTIQADDEYYEATTKSGKTTERISKEDHKGLSKIAEEIKTMVPDADEWVQPIRFDKASGGRVPLDGGGWPGMEEYYKETVAPDIDKKISDLMKAFKYYRERGGKKDLRDYINTWGIGGGLKEGGLAGMLGE